MRSSSSRTGPRRRSRCRAKSTARSRKPTRRSTRSGNRTWARSPSKARSARLITSRTTRRSRSEDDRHSTDQPGRGDARRGRESGQSFPGLGGRCRLSRGRLQGGQGFCRHASRSSEGEDALLLEHTLRDYRRAGLALPPDKRAEVEKLRKELAKLETDFQANIVAVKAPIVFSKAELEGVPDSILESPGVKTGDDSYTILANVTFHYNTVEENAKNEETRKHLYKVAIQSRAREKRSAAERYPRAPQPDRAASSATNRGTISRPKSKWRRTAAAAKSFINDLVAGIQPKFDAEVAELRKLKVAETKDPNAQINKWDWRYFQNQLKKAKIHRRYRSAARLFPVPAHARRDVQHLSEHLRAEIYQDHRAEKWIDDLQLYHGDRCGQRASRSGCFISICSRAKESSITSHNSASSPGSCCRTENISGPTVALICNFPPPAKDKPSLLSHQDVETLFHEFGHALHSIVTTRQVCPLLRHECPGGFCRSAVADAAKLGLEQEGARHFRGRLPRSVQKNSGGD